MAFIEMQDVTKEYTTVLRSKGMAGYVKSLFRSQKEVKMAVDHLNLTIEKGEMVGYIGPNGAGKSTTIKMLAGILTPTSGKIIVDGRVPYENRRENAMHMGVVFGQRSQLYWDLPMDEAFELYRKIYKVDPVVFKRNVDFFVELLQMQEFLRRPVRQLSLGQKMRAELAVALLHDPSIVYLDEPTIGLDVVAKNRIRKFILEVNREKNTTVILTTHDMSDIEQVCKRIVMIDQGKILYDGSLENFVAKNHGRYTLVADFAEEQAVIEDPRLKLEKEDGPRKWITFDKAEIGVGEAVSLLTQRHKISDLSIKEPQIEEIVREIYER